MSKIELTEQQTERLRRVWLAEPTHRGALQATADELVAMGLVRPASDDPMQREWEDVKARVAALEARVNRTAEVVSDMAPQVEELQTPDPHAAAKERAKLWGVELVTLKDGTCLFMTEKHYLSNPKPSWFPHVFSFRSPHYSGGHKTPSEAWSNFPTEPPPGWEAKAEPVCDCGKIEHGRHHSACPAASKAKPRTEADRLGEAVWNALKSPYSKSWSELVEHVKDSYCEAAIAVRKADRAAQLEPSHEEIAALLESLASHGIKGLSETAAYPALVAAARVRLEKAEGEQ